MNQPARPVDGDSLLSDATRLADAWKRQTDAEDRYVLSQLQLHATSDQLANKHEVAALTALVIELLPKEHADDLRLELYKAADYRRQLRLGRQPAKPNTPCDCRCGCRPFSDHAANNQETSS